MKPLRLLLFTFALFTFAQSRMLFASVDTLLSVTFRVNMEKAVRNHVFSPDSDFVYLVPLNQSEPVRMVPETGNLFAITFDDLPEGMPWAFRFKINDTVHESAIRSITPVTGGETYTAWWNNDPLAVTTFRVDMQFAVQGGLFTPETDSVVMAAIQDGTPFYYRMERIGTSLQYEHTDTLLFPGTIFRYKYRINTGATPGSYEPFLRLVRIPDTAMVFPCDFNNVNPLRQPMEFRCNMSYFIRTGRFNPENDYLDVAGNFNGNGAYDLLFDNDRDSIYSLSISLDTTWFVAGPLTFRFRINGDPLQAELQGKPDRSYSFHDTTGQNPNLFVCFYDDLNPAVPRPPVATQVGIQGPMIYKKFLSGIYTYESINGIPEGISTYRWLRSSNPEGTDAVEIDSATRITYVIDTLDIGRWLVFEVTPKAAGGDSATGKPVRAVASSSVSAWDVGIGDLTGPSVRLFPNPSSDEVNLECTLPLVRAEILDQTGKRVGMIHTEATRTLRIPLKNLPTGLYLVRGITREGLSGSGKLLKK